MKRIALVVLLLALAAPAGSQEKKGFFTEEELALVDEGLELLNMSRKDLAFDKLTGIEEMRLFRVPAVDMALEDPLFAADLAAQAAEVARGKVGAILEYAAWRLTEDRGILASPWERADVERLRRWAYQALVHEDAHDGAVPEPKEEDPEKFLALAVQGIAHCPSASDAARVRREVGEQVAMLEKFGTISPADGLVIAGEGDDVHDLRKDPPRILIDKGGNDRYIAPASASPDHPVCVVIDLGGDDVYGNGESLSCGVGFFGIGILWDKGDGNDRYSGGHCSLGTGIFGVGILIDEGGSDVYECKDTGQGAGAWGVGLLLDRGEGNDRFHADLFGQGFAYVGGFGLLHNEKGNDVYDAGGVHLHYPLFNDRFQSLSQGFSIGMRPHASGGLAFLIDDSGNDRYLCDIYGQGASYWFAYGALVDSDGNDTYDLGQYGQGGGIHLAAGVLLDLAGQDLYYNMHGVGTGGAHDFAVGILVDRKGDDYYAGSGGTMGGALTNSFALLLDGGGTDGYSAAKVRHAEGGGRSARGMGSIGLFIDRAGKDIHGTRELDGRSWTKETYGAGIDLPDPPPEAAPPRKPALPSEEAERRVRERAWDDEKVAWDLEKLWGVAREWAVGEMSAIVPVALDRLAELGDPAIEKALSRTATDDGLELRAVQMILKRFPERAVPRLVEHLAEEDPVRRARAAMLLADLGATGQAGKLLPLLGHEKTKRTTLDALARLGATDHADAVVPLLTDESERVRVTAARCLQKLGAVDATDALVRRLGGGEVFTVRFAVEDVLVSFNADALPALLPLAASGKDRTARRHGIRALGRIAHPATVVLLTKLLDGSDWRIRYEAAGALGAFVEKNEGAYGVFAKTSVKERLRVEKHPHVRVRLEDALK